MRKNNQPQLTAVAGRKVKNQPLGYVFLLPVLLSLTVFTFYPFFRSIYLTFFMADRLGNAKKFVGFGNYIRLWQNGSIQETIGDTLVYASLICVGTFCLALLLAYLCVDPVKGSRGYQTMFSLPLALATAPIAAVGGYIFGYNGMLNGLLGTQINWLGHDVYKIICLAVLVCWCNCGTSFIYLLVGFRNVPDDLIESANLDRASAWTKFFKIYLPIASPQLFYVLFLNILTPFKSFTMIKMLFGTNEEGLRVLSGTIYQSAILETRFETACVYSLILCVLIFLVTRVQFILEKKVVHYQ
jgi:sn-glycerol 3-phosphate transport system permease protein